VLFLGVTALVAMVVGGFVLANLFYLGVDERRSEIGLKMALGAPRWAILTQILLEAVILTSIGALFGMGLGMAMGQLLARLEILQILFSWKVFGFSLTASLVIGLLFGLKPARRAASLTPIDALKGNG
jgi:putative ABC transport system permease protein